MALEQELLGLEKQFWTGNADFYRKNVDTKCLCAFMEMAGVMTKEEIASTIKEGKRWTDLKLEKKGFLQPTNEFAILTYEASATRPDGKPYKAVVSSGYIKRDGSWKMALHQQTPLSVN